MTIRIQISFRLLMRDMLYSGSVRVYIKKKKKKTHKK